MIEVVYYLFNPLEISSQPGRLMLAKWAKVSEKRFNKILRTITKAKNEGLKISVDGREITLDNTESLLKNLGNFFFFFFLFIILRRYRFLIYKFTNSTMNINSYTN